MNLDKEWNFIIAETHSGKPNRGNLIKREMLFLLQILLSRIELAAINGKNFLSDVYFGLKEQYVAVNTG